MGMPRSTPYFSMAWRVYREQLGVYLQDAGNKGETYRRYTRIDPILAIRTHSLTSLKLSHACR